MAAPAGNVDALAVPPAIAMPPPSSARLDGAAIANLIPHQGAMCLLQRVDHWDADRIACSAASHRDAANPLRTAGGLLSPCAIEYAAQAMALHGALIGRAAGGAAATPGFLASVRGVRLHRLRLDDLVGELAIEAVRLAGDSRQILYRFNVAHAGQPVADGRATVVLNTPLAAAGDTAGADRDRSPLRAEDRRIGAGSAA